MVAALTVLTLALSQAPARLDASSFAEVRRYAEPTARDLSFQSLNWRDSVYEGLVEAQRQDKPLLMWLYFGDPRGHC